MLPNADADDADGAVVFTGAFITCWWVLPQVGNVGVEHAEPFDIQDSMLRARVARTDRVEFSQEEMKAWGLAGMHGSGPQEQWAAYGGVSTRRRLFAEALGLHDGSAKVLLKNLNYFFKRDEVEEALESECT